MSSSFEIFLNPLPDSEAATEFFPRASDSSLDLTIALTSTLQQSGAQQTHSGILAILSGKICGGVVIYSSAEIAFVLYYISQ